MTYILSGFLFGLLIPYMARRFSKFMPATMAYAIYRLIAPVKKVSKEKRKQNGVYQKLVHKYLMRSIGWGIISSALTLGVHLCLPSDFYIALVWILLLLYEIDERMFLLPDILTVPLLIIGFIYASTIPYDGHFMCCSPAFFSAVGAAIGYILPVIATLVMVKKNPDAFGGGDIKLLSAVGAWIGFYHVPVLILASAVLFGLFCLIKRERSGAFGPAIVITTLALVFFVI
ncbi:MAG: prepilin peptidase [Alphaproteobacteria bacterium]|nr:prepilin peptidase [Alphaproteobacteria bacterium]